MIKQSITYENFDGENVTEDHYFHLSKSELIDMEMAGGTEAMSDKLQRIVSSGNGAEIMRLFKDIISAAYGQRVDGSGSEFYKTPQISERFLGSLAFDQLLTDLLTDPGKAAVFVNGIIPKDLAATAEVRKAMQAVEDANLPVPGEDVGLNVVTNERGVANSGLRNPFDALGKPVPWAFREPTANEMMAMNTGQMQDVYQRKSSGWVPRDA